MCTIKENTFCSGCGACLGICPAEAISIEQDSEGFFSARVSEDKCTGCGLCSRVCKIAEFRSNDDLKPLEYHFDCRKEYYAARNKNQDIVRLSSSGGVFISMADAIIRNKGSVYGAVFDYPHGSVEYIRAENMDDCQKMMGSKYVQAHLSEKVIGMLLRDFEEKKDILFVGTSCCIAGLRELASIKNKGSNIWFVDFVCAGVLSPKLWDRELEYYSERVGSIKKLSFREKSHGWRDYHVCYEGDKGSCKHSFVLSNLGLLRRRNESSGRICNNCIFRTVEKPSDITLGDFWNEQYLPKKWWDDKGTSLVMINTEAGKKLFDRIYDTLELVPENKTAIMTKTLEFSLFRVDESKRKEFYSDLSEMDYEAFLNKYCRISLLERFVLLVLRPLLIKTGLLRLLGK